MPKIKQGARKATREQTQALVKRAQQAKGKKRKAAPTKPAAYGSKPMVKLKTGPTPKQKRARQAAAQKRAIQRLEKEAARPEPTVKIREFGPAGERIVTSLTSGRPFPFKRARAKGPPKIEDVPTPRPRERFRAPPPGYKRIIIPGRPVGPQVDPETGRPTKGSGRQYIYREIRPKFRAQKRRATKRRRA